MILKKRWIIVVVELSNGGLAKVYCIDSIYSMYCFKKYYLIELNFSTFTWRKKKLLATVDLIDSPNEIFTFNWLNYSLAFTSLYIGNSLRLLI